MTSLFNVNNGARGLCYINSNLGYYRKESQH